MSVRVYAGLGSTTLFFHPPITSPDLEALRDVASRVKPPVEVHVHHFALSKKRSPCVCSDLARVVRSAIGDNQIRLRMIGDIGLKDGHEVWIHHRKDTRTMPHLHGARRLAFQRLLGEAIFRERGKADLTRGKLAAACGVSESTIWAYEQGTTSVPAYALFELEHALGCNLYDLVPTDDAIEAALGKRESA